MPHPEGQRVRVVDEYLPTEDGSGIYHGAEAVIIYEDVDGYTIKSLSTGSVARAVKEDQIEAIIQ